jgi:hypothetical protein
MRYRIFIVFVIGFFITMNVLLFRSEFGSGRHGSPVPVATVWEKILNCPDSPFLEIRYKNTKIGRAHWSASIVEGPVVDGEDSEDMPEGMVKAFTGYNLDFDGSFTIDEITRLRFNSMLNLDTNNAWQQFSFNLILKPESWKIIATATNQTLRFISEGDEGTKEQVFTFAELRNPEKLARSLGGPLLPVTLGAMGLSLSQTGTNRMATNLRWHARQSSLAVGRSSIRAYRLEARLLERARLVLFVSPVGEILRIELPGEVVLNNEQFTGQ